MTQTNFDLHRSETSPILNSYISQTPNWVGPGYSTATISMWHGLLKEQGCNFSYVRWVLTWTPGSYGRVQLLSMISGGPTYPKAVETLKIAGDFEVRDHYTPRVDAVDVTQTFWDDLNSGELCKFYTMRMCGDNPFPLYSSSLEVVWAPPELEYVKRTADAMLSRIAKAVAAALLN